MSLVDEIEKLKKHLKHMAKAGEKVQTVWATVKSVDWDNKTMVATGVVDELDYYDVLLGLGSVYVKPVVGKLCLLGVIENTNKSTYLIHAEEVADVAMAVSEELAVSASDLKFAADSTVFNGGANGGLVILAKVLNNLNSIKTYSETMNAAIASALGTVDTSAGSASQAPYQTAMSGVSINIEDMENDKVKH